MSQSPFEIDTDTLHAFADGQLGDAEREAVERWLESHPTEAAEVAMWKRQNEALTALFAPVAMEPVPSRLSPHRIAHEIKTSRAASFRNIAAGLMLVLAGGVVGWGGRDYLVPAEASSYRLMDAAITAHTLYVKENSRAVEVPASASNLMSWLSNRLTTNIDAPDLSADGYTFLGGRLLPSDPQGLPAPAAQLMYENASAERLTLYITAALPDKKVEWEFADRDGVEAYYWANEMVTCTIVAELSQDQIKLLGRKIFEQLTRRPEASLHDW